MSAVAPRAAATVVLLRSANDLGGRSAGRRLGVEVLLARRPATMAFAGGMHVFPGGAVDPADADPALFARSRVGPAEAAARLGGDIEPIAALATWIAAVRESFEEAGVLFAEIGRPGVPRADARPALGDARPALGDARPALADARRALVRDQTTFAEIAEAFDLQLRTDLLVPLSRWVTPAGYPRRFDVRFFVAEAPEGAEPTLEGDEVAEHAWWTPRDALDAMAAGEMGLWLPTSSTLQQLEHVGHIGEVWSRLAPGPLGPILVDEPAPDVVRVVMPAGGGIAGQPVNAYLVGRTRYVLVDPGDPTAAALERCVAEATSRGGMIRAIALTHVDPDHAAGAEALAGELGIPILVGPGGGGSLPHPVRDLADGDLIDEADIPVRVILTPGLRPDHVAFAIGEGTAVLIGDLDGRRGSRSIVGPADEAAWERSRRRIDGLDPAAVRLAGHPSDRPGDPPRIAPTI